MKIIINGQEKHFDRVASVRSLIESICRQPEHVIAEINGAIIKKDLWEKTPIKDGDTVELVTLVGGG